MDPGFLRADEFAGLLNGNWTKLVITASNFCGHHPQTFSRHFALAKNLFGLKQPIFQILHFAGPSALEAPVYNILLSPILNLFRNSSRLSNSLSGISLE